MQAISNFVNGNKSNVSLALQDDVEKVVKEFERGMKVWTRKDLGGVMVYSDARRKLVAWVDYENCKGYKM